MWYQDPLILAAGGLGLLLLALQQITKPTTQESSGIRVVFFSALGLVGLYLMFTEGPKLLN